MFLIYFKAFALIYFINYVLCLPEDYCLHPLNKSDCKVKPTPVFSYYKSGSRCEIEIWRGCPTFNMFPNEFVCSHHCIGKLWDREGYNEVDIELPFEDECSVPVNKSDCGIEEQFKYTFNGTLCTKVEWRGCYSQNVFDDEEACVSACQQLDLKYELENLPTKDAEAINDLLDRVIADDGSNRLKYHSQQQLMLKLTQKPEDTITTTTVPVTEEKPVKTKSGTAKTTKKTVETTSEAAAATTKTVPVVQTTSKVTETSEAVKTTSKAVETTSEAVETTSEAVETTSKAVEATSEVQTSIQTTVESTTEAITTVTSTEAAETTTMGEGSAEEVILT